MKEYTVCYSNGIFVIEMPGRFTEIRSRVFHDELNSAHISNHFLIFPREQTGEQYYTLFTEEPKIYTSSRFENIVKWAQNQQKIDVKPAEPALPPNNIEFLVATAMHYDLKKLRPKTYS